MASRISPFGVERPPARLWLIPAASVVLGSMLALMPVGATVPLLPPFGLIALIGWRLLRPELWGAWIALPLGLADDLVGGAPLGSAVAIWTVVMLGLDFADHRIVWRNFGTDWGLAALALAFAAIAAWAFALFTGGAGPLWTALAQYGLALLAFPMVTRICGILDRRRLSGRREPH